MTDFLSLLISLAGLAFTVYMEWPKIQARRAKSAISPPQQPTAQKEQAVAASIPQANTDTAAGDAAPAIAGKTIGKTLFSFVAALIYGTTFASIFIPLGDDAIVGFAAFIFWGVCIYWAFRYVRYRSWRFVLVTFAMAPVSYLALVLVYVVFGLVDA